MGKGELWIRIPRRRARGTFSLEATDGIVVSFPPDFLIERRAIIPPTRSMARTPSASSSPSTAAPAGRVTTPPAPTVCAECGGPPNGRPRGGVFQMMARSVNEGGKVSPIAAIRNFRVLGKVPVAMRAPRSPMVEFR